MTCAESCRCRCDQSSCGCRVVAGHPLTVPVTCSLCAGKAKGRVVAGVVIYRCPVCDVRRCQHCGHYIEDPMIRDRCPKCRQDLQRPHP